MATLDFTLDGLLVPGLENYTPEFGTKKADNVKLTTEEVCKNVALAFRNQRGVEVTEDSETGSVEADRTVVMMKKNITLALGRPSYAGCRVTVVAGFTGDGSATVTYSTGEDSAETLTVLDGTCCALIGGSDLYFHRFQDVTGDNTSGQSVRHLWGKERWLTFDFSDSARRSVKIKAGTHIALDITSNGSLVRRWLDVEKDTTYDISAGMQAAADASATRTGETGGRDYYLYLVPDGTGVKMVVSCNSTFPNDISSDYTANNTRKIGQLHTLCADAGNSLTMTAPAAPNSAAAGDTYLVKQYDADDEDGFHKFYSKTITAVAAGTYYDTVTMEHPLAGFIAGDILPESVFCLTFHPWSDGSGMCYDTDTDIMADIYLQSGAGSSTASVYGAATTDTRQQPNHQDDMRQVRKRLLWDREFTSVALGSNEKTAIKGSADAGTTGGHTDTAGRRMLSAIGLEDCCGFLWQWLEDLGPVGGSAFGTYDGHASFGQSYGTPYGLLAGGDWSASASCGSRSRDASNARSRAHAHFGGRGSSRAVRGA